MEGGMMESQTGSMEPTSIMSRQVSPFNSDSVSSEGVEVFIEKEDAQKPRVSFSFQKEPADKLLALDACERFSEPGSPRVSSCDSTVEPHEHEDSSRESPDGSMVDRRELDYSSPAIPCTPVMVLACEFQGHGDSSPIELDSFEAVQCIPLVFMSPDGQWSTMPMTLPHGNVAMDQSMWPSTEGEYVVVPQADVPTLSEPPEVWRETVTVMMRNLPNKYSRDMLIEEISEAGFYNCFDFVHLPVDADTMKNKGYAFINFLDSLHSWSFKCYYEGRAMQRFNSNKCVTVVPAAFQGFLPNFATSGAASGGLSPALSSQKKWRRAGGRRSLIDEAAQAQQVQQECEKEANRKGSDETCQGENAQESVQPMVRQFCPYCGSKREPDFTFCQGCGRSPDL